MIGLEHLSPTGRDFVNRFAFDRLPPDRSVLWSYGGFVHDERNVSSVNEDVAERWMRFTNPQFDLNQNNYIYTSGKDLPANYPGFLTLDALVPKAKEWDGFPEYLDYWEEREIWKILSSRFVHNSSGVVSVFAHNSPHCTRMRLEEYQHILNTDAITDIAVLKPEAWKGIASSVLRTFEDDDFLVMNKFEWLEWQKTQWFENALAKYQRHLNGDALAEDAIYDESDRQPLLAKARFIGEIIFSLREVERLSERIAQGDQDASNSLKTEQDRLSQALHIAVQDPHFFEIDPVKGSKYVERYGEDTFITKKLSLAERFHRNFSRRDRIGDSTIGVRNDPKIVDYRDRGSFSITDLDTSLMPGMMLGIHHKHENSESVIVNEVGKLLLELDESKTLADKTALWGMGAPWTRTTKQCYTYGYYRIAEKGLKVRHMVDFHETRVQEMENYVQRFLNTLENRMRYAIGLSLDTPESQNQADIA